MRYGKYKATETGWTSSYEPLLPNLSVTDHTPTPTGVLDADGDMIYNLPLPIGFGRDAEW